MSSRIMPALTHPTILSLPHNPHTSPSLVFQTQLSSHEHEAISSAGHKVSTEQFIYLTPIYAP